MGIRLTSRIAAVSLCSAIALAAFGEPVNAETLRDALSAAYNSNPTLGAERARQRATDEGVPQALSGWRPTVTVDGDYGTIRQTTRPSTGVDKRDPRGYSLTLNQPVFDGFETVEGTKQAEANVQAGVQNLINVEQTTLLDGVTAYMNVVRDGAIVRLRQKNVSVLKEQLRAANARFKVGEITKTDVAQAEARVAGAVSDLALAKSNLATSRANYRRIIGRAPGSLRYPPSIARLLPKTLKKAIATARDRNPTLLAAAYNEEASRHAIEVARSNLLPDASLEAQYQRRYDLSAALNRQESVSLIGRLNVPLYQGGLVHSQVREAKQTNSQRVLQIAEADRQVVEAVVSAWEQYAAALEQINSDRAQVEANRLAFKGVEQEALVGSRTTLDVLDAEQELLDSQVSLVGSRRDAVVAAYTLLSAIGRLTARDLRLPVQYYDPSVYYQYTRGKLFGVGIGESQ